MSAEIQGSCEAQFTPVQDALARNFAEHDEIGCAVTVYHDGKKVVDLWGGHMDTQRTKPWREDTLCIMYSIAKSMCATSVHILADRGLVDLDAPVADYWPEFAQNGKAEVKVPRLTREERAARAVGHVGVRGRRVRRAVLPRARVPGAARGRRRWSS